MKRLAGSLISNFLWEKNNVLVDNYEATATLYDN